MKRRLVVSVAAVEAATAAEAAETSTTDTSAAIVVATAVAVTKAAAVVAAVQAGHFFFLLPWWRFPLVHRASPLEYPRLLDVTAVFEAAVLRGADYYSSCPHGMLRNCYPVFRSIHSSSGKGLQSSYHQTQIRLAMESPFLREQPCFWCTINSVLVDPGARVHY